MTAGDPSSPPAVAALDGAPRNALNLALARVVLCGLVLSSSEVLDAALWAEWARSMRAPAVGLGWAQPLVDLSAAWLRPVQATTLIGASLALVGWRVRWTLPVAALAAGVLFALPHFSGGPRHSMHLVWFLVVLAFSPCALRLRLPGWNERRRALVADAPSSDLALALLRGLLAVIYFFPGYWKLRESGLDWIFSDNLQNQMFWKWYQFGALPTWRVDRHPELVQLGALGVVLLELSFPLLMARPRLRAFAAALGLGFHVAAAKLMFLPFAALFACYVVLVDWEWLLAWLADERPAQTPSRGLALGRAIVTTSPEEGGSGLRRLAVAGGVLLVAATGAGLSGQMRAYPFACYPTFQWIAGGSMPDLWIEVSHGGERRWLPDSPAHGGVRPQARWGMAWRAAGVYAEPVPREQLLGYYAALPATVRGDARPGDRLRFYRAEIAVRPEARQAPPITLTRLAELTIE
jgi:hypothetical protein